MRLSTRPEAETDWKNKRGASYLGKGSGVGLTMVGASSLRSSSATEDGCRRVRQRVCQRLWVGFLGATATWKGL